MGVSEQLKQICEDALSRKDFTWEDMAHVMDACDVFIKEPFDPLSPEAWTFYVLLGTTIIAAVAVGVAVKTISANRATAKKLATLGVIEQHETTPPYRIGRRAFHYFAGHDARTLALLAGDFPRDQRAAVIDYLNYFEAVAAGVYEQILSKEHVERLLQNMMRNTWCQGVFFIHQFRYNRDAETRRLLRDENDEPIHSSTIFVEFQNLAEEFGVPAALLPPKEGNWKLTKADLKKLAIHSLRIPPPKDREEQGIFDEVLNDLVLLVSPREPHELGAIGSRRAYHRKSDTSPKVLPILKPLGDPQIQSVGATLEEMRAALEDLSAAVREARQGSPT